MPRTASKNRSLVAPPHRIGGEALFSVARQLHRERFSGRMNIERPGVDAYVDFRDGEIVGARYHHHVGRAAFSRALRVRTGRAHFSVLPGDAQPIARFADMLKAAQGDDQRVSQQATAAGGLDRVWEMRFSALKGRLGRMPDEINPILRLVDGRRSVRDIIETSAHEATLVVRVLARLLRMGLLVMPDAFSEVPASPLSDALERGVSTTPRLSSDRDVNPEWFDSIPPQAADEGEQADADAERRTDAPSDAKSVESLADASPDATLPYAKAEGHADAAAGGDAGPSDTAEVDASGDDIIRPHESVLPQPASSATEIPKAAAASTIAATTDSDGDSAATAPADAAQPKVVPDVADDGDDASSQVAAATSEPPTAAKVGEGQSKPPVAPTMGPRLFDANQAASDASPPADAAKAADAPDDAAVGDAPDESDEGRHEKNVAADHDADVGDRTGPPTYASTIRPLPADVGDDDGNDDDHAEQPSLDDVHLSHWSVGSETPQENAPDSVLDDGEAADAGGAIVASTLAPPKAAADAADSVDAPASAKAEDVQRHEEALNSWLGDDDAFFRTPQQDLVKVPETSPVAVGMLVVLALAVVGVVGYFVWSFTQPKVTFTDAQADAKIESAESSILGGDADAGCDELSAVKKGIRNDLPQYRRAWDLYEKHCR